jgi:hypothetical protein
LRNSPHLGGTISHLLHLLNPLSHPLYRLLEFCIFWRDAEQVLNALSYQTTHLFSFHRSDQQANA